MRAIVLAFVLALTLHWVRVKDAYRMHERYMLREHDGSELLIGEYYEVEPGDMRAECAGGAPQGVPNEAAARAFVLGCAGLP